MKQITFSKQFTVDKKAKQTPTFEEYVNKTAKLIKRPYFQTFKMVEDWAEHKIISRYKYCTEEYQGDIPPHILWWTLRKKDNENTQKN